MNKILLLLFKNLKLLMGKTSLHQKKNIKGQSTYLEVAEVKDIRCRGRQGKAQEV